jgi:hypothetical protein
VYSYAQGIEEQAYDKRQQVELEKMRASAGGIVLHTPTAPAGGHVSTPPQQSSAVTDDAMVALAQLKKLREADLISDEEFDTKRSEILARL